MHSFKNVRNVIWQWPMYELSVKIWYLLEELPPSLQNKRLHVWVLGHYITLNRRRKEKESERIWESFFPLVYSLRWPWWQGWVSLKTGALPGLPACGKGPVMGILHCSPSLLTRSSAEGESCDANTAGGDLIHSTTLLGLKGWLSVHTFWDL